MKKKIKNTYYLKTSIADTLTKRKEYIYDANGVLKEEIYHE